MTVEGKHQQQTVRWIDMVDPDPATIASGLAGLDIHPLALEDLQKAHQRPKLERYGPMTMIVAKPASYDDPTERILIGELSMVVGDEFLVTVRRGQAAARLAGVATDGGERLIDRSRQCIVIHNLLDETVDRYLEIAQELSIDISQIEADVFSVEFTNPSARIYRLKRQVLELLRNVESLIAPLDELSVSPALRCGTRTNQTEYFRDVADHTRRLVSELRRDSSLLSDILQANLSQMSVAQNEEMRRMTAWAAIFLAPTLMAGIWGMNFRFMPELEWRFGYALALASMVTVAGLLWLNFRRLGWLGSRDGNDRA